MQAVRHMSETRLSWCNNKVYEQRAHTHKHANLTIIIFKQSSIASLTNTMRDAVIFWFSYFRISVALCMWIQWHVIVKWNTLKLIWNNKKLNPHVTCPFPSHRHSSNHSTNFPCVMIFCCNCCSFVVVVVVFLWCRRRDAILASVTVVIASYMYVFTTNLTLDITSKHIKVLYLNRFSNCC